MATITLSLLLTTSVTACGDDAESGTCLSAGEGEVCAFTSVRNGRGGISFTGSGLEPGSRVALDSNFTSTAGYPVDDDGDLIEPVAVALSRAQDVVFEVTASSADGQALTGTIEVSAEELGG